MVGIFLVLQLSSARTNESWVFVTDDSFDDLTARTIASEGCIRLNKISFVLHWSPLGVASGQWRPSPHLCAGGDAAAFVVNAASVGEAFSLEPIHYRRARNTQAL